MKSQSKKLFVVLTIGVVAVVFVLRPGTQAQESQEHFSAKQKQDTAERSMMQCPMMEGLKGVSLFADSPAVLAAQAKKLDLTEEQVQKLRQIEQSTREQARQILNEEQREQLADEPKDRLSMMELCMLRMKGMDMNKTEQQPGGMCPMCAKMMRQMRERQGAEKENQK